MPLTDRDLLAQDQDHPLIVDLWLALRALGSVTSFMQTGAHPDDETSTMLAPLRFRDGLSTSYLCSTRGEGGQNDIGAETVRDLGVIRTAEMERAAAALDLRMYWLSETPEDAIFDFGFSKSGVETMGIWGRDRTIARFVDVLRQEKPDIICPTFLDVGGQHGHHRAMTEAAHIVFEAAADPAFKGSDLAPWTVSKLYLPAWGGGGGSYDDDEPPPPATVTVDCRDRDPVTGWSYANMAQRSRAFHLTQGMGSWVAPGAEQDRALHLAASRVGADSAAVTDNLPRNLADLGLEAAGRALAEAQAAFPDRAAVAAAAAEALRLLDGAVVAPEHAHRLPVKRRELARVLRLALGVGARARSGRDWLWPGASGALRIESDKGRAESLEVRPVLPTGWHLRDGAVEIDGTAAVADPYPVAYDPLRPRLPALALKIGLGGQVVEDLLPIDSPPQVGPAKSARLVPTAALINLALPVGAVTVHLADLRPEAARPELSLPDGWRQDWSGPQALLIPPDGLQEGIVEAPLLLDGEPAPSEHRFAYKHIAPRLRSFPARLRILAAHVALPQVRVGYVGTGNDRVLDWLRAMGLDTVDLSETDLGDGEGFEGIGALVVGVFGFRNPRLAAALPRLHDWVAAGGTLLTLYHRPGDNWAPQTTPPRPIQIGSPSLRYRVTDQNAAVTHLSPDHPVLTGPNRIGPEDWQGWAKERGLYFAKSWDAAYLPLIELADPGEAPHRGALLSAEIGQGRHNHCALNLHHQLPELTPGAFRLMANLLARRGG
ncbi:PIG-L family deacetylase [Frigidibacter sp. ROC022]|uniref:PIG-L family deacetylase n=1 Tax=Frigidibacter sp. ROC022 TaxID=2971796 RepID=UPI00215A1CE7|nr:PIG-L family deacetylase [Frigidibacter sp. ROC022]MCR8723297.1 PIG-L family deacetylase [Frigidibacter sp. ROC022]